MTIISEHDMCMKRILGCANQLRASRRKKNKPLRVRLAKARLLSSSSHPTEGLGARLTGVRSACVTRIGA